MHERRESWFSIENSDSDTDTQVMTLIITAVDKDRVVQVSDRRLTDPNGEVHDHHANKAVCIGMGYVHFATSYTGLAYIGGRAREDHRTDYWLVENLGEIMRDGEPSLEDICSAIGERAASALSRLPSNVRGAPLTFVMAGYDRENRPFRATITNTRAGSGVMATRDRFISDVRRFYPWDRRPDIHVAGAVAVFEAKDKYARALAKVRTTVVRHMRRHSERLDDMQVARYLVSLVRSATTHPQFGHLIGRDCLSVIAFPRKPGMLGAVTMSIDQSGPRPDSPFRSHYHPVSASTILYGPRQADPYITTLNFEVDLDPKPLDLAAPLELPVKTSHRGTGGSARERTAVTPDPPRDTIAHYFASYYQEARSQLAGNSFSPETLPSHLMPWHKLVRTWETKDGYIVVEHITQPSDASYRENRAVRSDRWEDYLHLYPRTDQTLNEMTGMEGNEGVVPLTKTYGRLIDDAGYLDVQKGDYLQRVDATPKGKVPELTEEKAREAARVDMRPYVE